MESSSVRRGGLWWRPVVASSVGMPPHGMPGYPMGDLPQPPSRPVHRPILPSPREPKRSSAVGVVAVLAILLLLCVVLFRRTRGGTYFLDTLLPEEGYWCDPSLAIKRATVVVALLALAIVAIVGIVRASKK